MKYSVIIPTIGRKSVLQSIESVMNQTVKPNQILVILNQNPDKTLLVDAIGNDVQLFFNDKPGVSNARNLGMEKVSKEIDLVAFLDDDDAWLDNKMELQIQFIKDQHLTKDDYWLVSSGAYVVNPKNQISKRPKVWYENSKSLSRQLYQFSWKRSSVYVPTPSWIISRKVATDLRFDPNLHNREDISFLLDIESNKGKIYQVHEYLCSIASDKSRGATRENLTDYINWIAKLSKINLLSALAFATGVGFKTLVFSLIHKLRNLTIKNQI